MIDFFELLNTCSPLRATGYMAFILMFFFITYSFIEGVIKALSNKDCEDDEDEGSHQQLND